MAGATTTPKYGNLATKMQRHFSLVKMFMEMVGWRMISLDWRVKHMNYGVGRCLELNLTRTNYSETTIILKFNNFENFTEGVKVDLTITGVH